MMSPEVHYYQDYMHHLRCEWFISFHKVFHPLYGIEFSDRKILNFTYLTDLLYNDRESKNVTDYLKQITAKMTCTVRQHDPTAYINYTHLTEWDAPIHQPLHTDFDEHAWTSVLYLNDNFTGGSTIVGGEYIKPKAGDMILFRGKDILHGVEEVTSGSRYTITTWYKNDY